MRGRGTISRFGGNESGHVARIVTDAFTSTIISKVQRERNAQKLASEKAAHEKERRERIAKCKTFSKGKNVRLKDGRIGVIESINTNTGTVFVNMPGRGGDSLAFSPDTLTRVRRKKGRG